MTTTLAIVFGAGLGTGGWLYRRWRRRQQAARPPDPMPLNTERAQALRSLAAADYAKFTARRNGRST